MKNTTPPNGSLSAPFPTLSASMSLSRSINREPCHCCRRPRLTCWGDPCPYLLGLTKEIWDPKAYEKLCQWCAEGGFGLYRTDNLNWPVARPWFVVGDGANYAFNGDAYPVTVVEVSPSGTRIVVRRDRTTKYGFFVVDPEGKKMMFTLRKDGAYRSSKCGTWVLDLGRAARRNREL